MSKAKELEALCEASLLTPPDVSGLLLEMGQARTPGQATGQVSSTFSMPRLDTRMTESAALPDAKQIGEVLSKLVRMIGEVESESRKRSTLVALVSELESAREELGWVTAWENDENRYKV